MPGYARSLVVIALLAVILPLTAVVTRSAQEPTTSVLGWYDLPKDDQRSQEVSGLTWDPESATLYGITDDAPRIVRLNTGEDFRSVSFGETITVTVPDLWDGEAIARTSTSFFITNENGPHIYELDHTGQLVSWVPVPGHFNRIRPNQSLESLTIADDGRYVFTANEQALDGDGPRATVEAGTVVRIVRFDRATQDTLEWAYETDPVFASGEGGDNGVAELAALSASDLLVLERSFVPNIGNSIRIYRVSLAEPTNIFELGVLSSDTPVVAKTLVVDLATLPDTDFPPTLQPQPNRVLDNFEGLALGPVLPDGRRVIFLISDDNKRTTQIPRLLTLAVAGL
jgi:hypothetical protein